MRFFKLEERRTELQQRQNVVLTELRRKQTRLSLDRFSHALRVLDNDRPAPPHPEAADGVCA